MSKAIPTTCEVSDKNFYTNLKTLKLSLPEVFRSGTFFNIPADWHVVIADVKNSTAAVNNGHHNDVNLVAASSLVVSLNIARAAKLEIPFFFTGDGGTVFVPEEILTQVLEGLRIHNNNSVQNFGLVLHVGSMSVGSINSAGHGLQIAKVKMGKGFTKAIIIGDGLKYAEQVIKEGVNEDDETAGDPSLLDMKGLECRWDKIKPPMSQAEIVCYLVEAIQPAMQLQVYAEVLQKIEEIYGDAEKRNPLSVDKLKLLLTVNKIRKEMKVRFGRWKRSSVFITFLKTYFGQLYFRFNLKINNLRGREYLKQVISNADTLTIDRRINTIIAGSAAKRIQLLMFLEDREMKGELVFGHFISKESVMTCYIENRNDKHIHFVDGSDGGYTEAAKQLKQKLKAIHQSS